LAAAVAFDRVTKVFSLDHGRPRSFKDAFLSVVHGRERSGERLVALDDVSFALDVGDTLGLVGPNGTGKSTVLKLVARILEPTSGRVAVTGRVAALLELGAGFHPDLTGRENVMLNGSMMGFSRADMKGRLDAIVAFSELERFIDMPVKHYSSGMYMRLGFAAAVNMDADTLLIDEVLAVGDQSFQNKCRDKIAAMRRAGMTILLVSHDPGAVRDLCRSALWLEGGTARAFGATDDVLEAYYASVMAREEARFAAEHGAVADKGGEGEEAWGSGEVEIVSVDLVGPDGRDQHVVASGAPVTVRVRYVAHERVEAPVFGLAIHRNDGLHINGPNTLDGGLYIEAVEGPGTITYRVASLPLLEGAYELSASCYDRSCTHPYAHHHRRYPFRVHGGAVRERFGLVLVRAEWGHEPEPLREPSLAR
jgi:ABC-type polysaccharide/polyol phosphate transport system ATPase subunit